MKYLSEYRLPTPYRGCQGCKWFEALGADGKLFCQYHGIVDGPMLICIAKETEDEADTQTRHQG